MQLSVHLSTLFSLFWGKPFWLLLTLLTSPWSLLFLICLTPCWSLTETHSPELWLDLTFLPFWIRLWRIEAGPAGRNPTSGSHEARFKGKLSWLTVLICYAVFSLYDRRGEERIAKRIVRMAPCKCLPGLLPTGPDTISCGDILRFCWLCNLFGLSMWWMSCFPALPRTLGEQGARGHC